MKDSILNGRRILAVDNDRDILSVMEEEIKYAYPSCFFDKADSYEVAIDKVNSGYYDLVIVDIADVCSFDVLEAAIVRNFNAVVLSTESTDPNILRYAFDSGALAYFPKERLGDIVKFIENDISYIFASAWKDFTESLYKYS